MNILALVESAEHVCYRYRIAAFAPALRGAGHELVVQPLHRKLAGRVRQFWAASDHDTVIVQRKLLPGWQWALLRRRARRLVFDVDDALMHRDSYHPKGVYDAAREARFARVARECDALLLGNDFLRGRAIDAGARASRALFLPTCIDLSKYKISDHTRRAGGLRLVWVGSSSTLKGLEQSAAIWAELGRRHSWLALRLVSDRFARFGSLVIEDRAWSEKTEAGEIAG